MADEDYVIWGKEVSGRIREYGTTTRFIALYGARTLSVEWEHSSRIGEGVLINADRMKQMKETAEIDNEMTF
jgi:hypothetical protein